MKITVDSKASRPGIGALWFALAAAGCASPASPRDAAVGADAPAVGDRVDAPAASDVGDGAAPDDAPGVVCAASDAGVGTDAAPSTACVPAGGLPALTFAFARDERMVDPALALLPGERAEGLLLPEKRHVVVVPRHRAPRDELFVFLGGSGGIPANNQSILRVGALAGFRGIGLAYVNDPSVEERCEGDGPDCELAVRLENLRGVDQSPRLEIDEPNSIEGRLRRLLRYLAAQQPAGGWDRYLDGTRIAWSRVVIGGFSQGGGQAGLIAREYPVARAIYVSKAIGAVENPAAPGTPVPAPWVSTPRATPPAREFAIVHRCEGAWGYSLQAFATWGMNRAGDFADVDAAPAPYGCTHLLSTAVLPSSGTYRDAHQSMANDALCSKDAAGVCRNAPAWLYMLSSGW